MRKCICLVSEKMHEGERDDDPLIWLVPIIAEFKFFGLLFGIFIWFCPLCSLKKGIKFFSVSYFVYDGIVV